MNPAYERLIGISRIQAVGALVSELYDHVQAPNLEIYTKIDGTGEPILFDTFFPPTGKHLQIIASRIAPGRFCTLITDITARKQAEEERERLLSAIEQDGEMIVITDPDGTIQYVNPAFERVTGYTREEATGENPRILKSGIQDDLFYRNLWATISGGGTFQGRIVNKRKDGSLFTEEASIAPVRDASGRIVNYVAVKHDITDHLRVTDQLHQAQKMEFVGRLAGGVAHDYNKQTIAPKVLDLNEVVESALKMLRRLIGEDIDFSWRPENQLWPILIDPSQLEQILANLCVNARDAISGVGKITIETHTATFDKAYCTDHPGFIPGEFVLLLITDVVMPGMNGRDLAKQLNVLFPGIKTLFMSGYTANVIAHRGVLEEGVQFIHKPFSINDLGLKIREILDDNNDGSN